MLFAVDIGNTNMEFGVFEDNKRLASFRLATNYEITSDEIGLMIRQFLNVHDVKIERIKDVLIASVVPQVLYTVRNAMRKYLHKEAVVVHDDVSIDIVNKYKNPTEVGADRLVNAYAGLIKYGAPLIVVDFGTATTFDVINENGEYLGGIIYPGIKISLDALIQRASKLPKVEINKPQKIIGDTTINSIQSGVVLGYTGAVENIVKQIETELGNKCKVIATGGLASFIGQQTDIISVIDKYLTLEGLNMIYNNTINKAGDL